MASKRNLYDILKQAEAKRAQEDAGSERTEALDSTERVKVLSPGRLVSKRFFRNRLAMVGLGILIVMFAFAFAGPLFYPYSQTQIFYKYAELRVDYAMASQRTDYVSYVVPGAPGVDYSVVNRINSYITSMVSGGVTSMDVTDSNGTAYTLQLLGDRAYTLSTASQIPVATYYGPVSLGIYDRRVDNFAWNAGMAQSADFAAAFRAAFSAGDTGFTFDGADYSITAARKDQYTITRTGTSISFADTDLGADFEAAAAQNLANGSFTFGGGTYNVTDNGDGSFALTQTGGVEVALVASTFVFNSTDTSRQFTDGFKAAALMALYGSGSFTSDGADYTIRRDTADSDVTVSDGTGAQVAVLGTFSIKRYSGQDTLALDFKQAAQGVIENMLAQKLTTSGFTFKLPQLDKQGNVVTNDDGSVSYVDTDITVTQSQTGEFVLTCDQITHLIDIYAPPSRQNLLGTDGDGMDILARMMYGGRISLMVGFVVVIIELILGAIMGGLAGFFGGWVDMLVMRLVDIFFCIPTIPILLIMGAMFDKIKMDPYTRLIWMMAILGILGWAGIARLIRGQILSLREQEFMVAQEATGMRSATRIFKHLIPNVIPLLIVQATLDLGGVILYEATLSFLGLGVKRPMATWGSIINAVTNSPSDMTRYAYIWVPAGLLICLTVIAFNFVGDGLRDAFDPKSKQ